MQKSKSTGITAEKILLAVALLMCGAICFYNAFFIPEVPADIKLSGDLSMNKMAQTSTTESEITNNIDGGKVNLNTADKETLVEFLPGVGPKIADRIISYRETHGGFSEIEEILNIKGISTKIFENIKKYIKVE